eukprot:m.234667 g.234667  ORF g.234667 m.234667 type:complete len:1143 (+) comp16037_c0_seq24:128-3556(+)
MEGSTSVFEKEFIRAEDETHAFPRAANSPKATPSPREIADAIQLKKLIQHEGRTARNIVSWSVPPEDSAGWFTVHRRKKKHTKEGTGEKGKKARHVRRRKEPGQKRKGSKSNSSGGNGSPGSPRVRVDARTRFWRTMLDNLHRSIDELYAVCEHGENELECEEVRSVLNTAREDFEALIRRIKLQSEYEMADEDSKPQSLAWSVRKVSPARSIANITAEPFMSSNASVRSMLFPEFEKLGNRKLSWADRVRGNDPGNSGSAAENFHPDEHDGEVQQKPNSLAAYVTATEDVEKEFMEGRKKSENAESLEPLLDEPPLLESSGIWEDITEESRLDSSGALITSPGGSVLLHQKLSSPSRKRPPAENARISKERQDRASRAREKLQQEMTERLQAQHTMIKAAHKRREDKGKRVEEEITVKMERAEKQRDSIIKNVVRKAQEEDLKKNEIAFINKLEFQNKKQEVIARLNESQERLNEREEERQRKALEKAARGDAAIARKKALEAQRAAKLEEKTTRRLQREAKLEEERARAAKEREVARNQRLQLAEKRRELLHSELRTTGDRKTKKTERKGKSNVDTVDSSEAVGGRGKKQKQKKETNRNPKPANQEVEVEVVQAEELQRKSINMDIPLIEKANRRKKSKRIRQNFYKISKGVNLFGIKEDADKTSGHHVVENLLKHITVQRDKQALSELLSWCLNTPATKTGEDQSKCLTHIHKAFGVHSDRLMEEKEAVFVVLVFYCQVVCGAFQHQGIVEVPQKTIANLNSAALTASLMMEALGNRAFRALSSWNLVLRLCDSVCMLLPLTMLQRDHQEVLLLGFILQRYLCSFVSDDKQTQNSDESLNSTEEKPDNIEFAQLTISYLNVIGLFERLTACCGGLQCVLTPEKGTTAGNNLLELCLSLILAAVNIPGKTNSTDGEALNSALSNVWALDVYGSVRSLCALLLHPGRSRPEVPPFILTESLASLALTTMLILNRLAIVDLAGLQKFLGTEPAVIEICHIIARLLSSCSNSLSANKNPAITKQRRLLLHEVILLVGFFGVENSHNQECLRSAGSANILVTLCSLPFQYFSDPKLMDVLFPTLLCSCFRNSGNTDVLQKEISVSMLKKYVQSLTRDSKSTGNKFECGIRFPQRLWEDAKEYFS